MDKLFLFVSRLICAEKIDSQEKLQSENTFLKAQVSRYQETRRYYVAAALFAACVVFAFMGWVI